MLFGLSWPKWSTGLPVPALLYCHTLHLRKGSTIEDLPSLSQGYWKLDVILRLDLFPAFNQDNCLKSGSYTAIHPILPFYPTTWLGNYEKEKIRGNAMLLFIIVEGYLFKTHSFCSLDLAILCCRLGSCLVKGEYKEMKSSEYYS